LPEDISFKALIATVKMRWRIERDYRELKQEVGRVSRTQVKACAAVLKMGADLPKPACRSWLQTTRCCCAQKVW